MAEAFAAGRVGIDSVSAILSGLKQAADGCDATPENMDAAEARLVEAAINDTADSIAAQARLWRDAMDPDGIEPRHEEIRARRDSSATRIERAQRLSTRSGTACSSPA